MGGCNRIPRSETRWRWWRAAHFLSLGKHRWLGLARRDTKRTGLWHTVDFRPHQTGLSSYVGCISCCLGFHCLWMLWQAYHICHWSVASEFGEFWRRDDLLRKEQVIMRWNAGCGHEPWERNLGVEAGGECRLEQGPQGSLPNLREAWQMSLWCVCFFFPAGSARPEVVSHCGCQSEEPLPAWLTGSHWLPSLCQDPRQKPDLSEFRQLSGGEDQGGQCASYGNRPSFGALIWRSQFQWLWQIAVFRDWNQWTVLRLSSLGDSVCRNIQWKFPAGCHCAGCHWQGRHEQLRPYVVPRTHASCQRVWLVHPSQFHALIPLNSGCQLWYLFEHCCELPRDSRHCSKWTRIIYVQGTLESPECYIVAGDPLAPLQGSAPWAPRSTPCSRPNRPQSSLAWGKCWRESTIRTTSKVPWNHLVFAECRNLRMIERGLIWIMWNFKMQFPGSRCDQQICPSTCSPST